MADAEWLTEKEWTTTSDTWRMLHIVRHCKPSDRKARLLNVAICRLIWGLLPEGSKAVLAESERLADNLVSVTPDELCRRANTAMPPWDPILGSTIEREAATAVCYAVLPQEMFVAAMTCRRIDPKDERPQRIIRDIFGNPFRLVALNPSWLTWIDGTVRRIAEGIYEERRLPDGTLDSARLAILSDALLDAGCDNEELLTHLRSEGPHVPGCWPVDLLLGKE